ncbi:hypothetical protein [Phycicoccus avicenniae]|uniref:hypothetical protein n=1 Tax=Phycicoccus avicenniae TaxID=2828860 RepID=UPI003D2896BD
MRRRGAVAAVVLVVLGGLAAGCSDLRPPRVPTASSTAPAPEPSLPSTADAFREARTFALSAGSAHLVGTLGAGRSTVRVDLEGSASAANERLVRRAPGRGVAVVLVVGDGHWLAGDAAFWRTRTRSAAAVTARVGRWLPVSAAQASAVGPERVRDVLATVFSAPSVAALEGVPDPVVATEVDGRPAWLLGSEARGARVWVAADSGGEVLRIAVSGERALDLVASGWERARTWSAPAAGEVPDLG